MPPDRRRTIVATTHPIAVGAAVLVLVNDFVLRGWAPGWLTGKLSDVGWLVVAPVLVAALLAAVGVGGVWARRGGLAVAGGFYFALQVWPPLGAAIRPGHVADLGDLLALPALFGAVLAWRTARVPRGPAWAGALGVPLLTGTLLADDWSVGTALSWPCGDDGMTWPADAPLFIVAGGFFSANTDAFARGVTLTEDATGQRVALIFGEETGTIYACARDGLRGDTAYTWTIGPWTASSNEAAPSMPPLPTVRFRTLPGDGTPVATLAECTARVKPLDEATYAACRLVEVPPSDTGDTGDTGDTSAAAR